MANPAIIVDFIANTGDLQAGFRKAQGATSSFGSRLKGIGKASLAAAGTAGIGALVATVKTGIDEFSEASKVSAQTAAAIKSTGGAAGVTAGDISKLAGSLMKKSGVDDEAIQSGENLLLTFTNIRNEAGKGNDVFDQTTKAALDMSVALGTDMKSAAMQLGKALNDPVKGVTKLTRSGVTFTDQQKEQIAALQASGKTLEAQKIILAEVNKEFGGSAAAAGKTLPGQLNILKESFSNMAGELVGQLVPAFTALLGTFTGVLGVLGQYKGVLPVIVIAMVGLGAAVVTVNAAIAAWTAVTMIAQGAAKAWTAAQWLLNAALAANPIGLVIVAVAALVAAFVIAYKTSDTFRAIVDRAFDAVLRAAQAVWSWLKSNWPTLLAVLTGPIGIAVVTLARHWGDIRDAVSSAFSAIRNAVTDGVSDVKGFLNGLASWISAFAHGALSLALNAAGNVFDAIAGGARDAYESVQRNLNGIVNFIEGIAGKVSSAAHSVANAIKGPINAVLSAWNSITLTIPRINIPKLKIGKKTFGGGGFGGQSIGFPNVPLLAKGGIVTAPTLAMVGEAGPEAVIPLDRMSAPNVQVRVFIGDQELTSLVRTEIVDSNTGLARALLAG